MGDVVHLKRREPQKVPAVLPDSKPQARSNPHFTVDFAALTIGGLALALVVALAALP